MTRRALRPKVSVGAGVAPVISKAEGVPCGAFGSIAVLIPRFAFPALVGGARRRKILSQKECGAKRAPSSLCLRVLRLAGGREIPYRRQARLRGPPRFICLVPSGAQNNPSRLACQEYNTIYWVCLFVRSHRACTLRFYLRRVAGRFLGENRRVPAPARGFAEAVGGRSFSSNSPGASGRRTRGQDFEGDEKRTRGHARARDRGGRTHTLHGGGDDEHRGRGRAPSPDLAH